MTLLNTWNWDAIGHGENVWQVNGTSKTAFKRQSSVWEQWHTQGRLPPPVLLAQAAQPSGAELGCSFKAKARTSCPPYILINQRGGIALRCCSIENVWFQYQFFCASPSTLPQGFFAVFEGEKQGVIIQSQPSPATKEITCKVSLTYRTLNLSLKGIRISVTSIQLFHSATRS